VRFEKEVSFCACVRACVRARARARARVCVCTRESEEGPKFDYRFAPGGFGVADEGNGQLEHMEIHTRATGEHHQKQQVLQQNTLLEDSARG